MINPNLLKLYYRKKAQEKGVIFEDRVWVTGAEVSANGVEIKADRFSEPLSVENKVSLYKQRKNFDLKSTQSKFSANTVVNCAGPWAPKTAEILGYSCPSFPVRRQVCIFDCKEVDLTHFGMIVDTSGVYFHPEAGHGLAGFANHDESPGVNFKYDGENFFMEKIWPALYERSTGFEKLKHKTGWAGLYEVSPDESAIIGAVGGGAHVFEAHSFSGHGAMHSYGAGLALAEKIIFGEYRTLDASVLSGDRFKTGKLLRESLVI